jgi:hypothetical protein
MVLDTSVSGVAGLHTKSKASSSVWQCSPYRWFKYAYDEATEPKSYTGTFTLYGQVVFAQIVKVTLTPQQREKNIGDIFMYHVLPSPETAAT